MKVGDIINFFNQMDKDLSEKAYDEHVSSVEEALPDRKEGDASCGTQPHLTPTSQGKAAPTFEPKAQPAPATEIRWDSTGRELPPRKPAPATGEWTQEAVRDLYESCGAVIIADTHNACIADERKKREGIENRLGVAFDRMVADYQKQLVELEREVVECNRYVSQASVKVADAERKLAADLEKREEAERDSKADSDENDRLRDVLLHKQLQLDAEREALEKLIKLWNASDKNDDPKPIQKAIDEGIRLLAKHREAGKDEACKRIVLREQLDAAVEALERVGKDIQRGINRPSLLRSINASLAKIKEGK